MALPTVNTSGITSIGATTATGAGYLLTTVGTTTRGLVWSTSTTPTVALATKTATVAGVGTFTGALTGLLTNSTYYVRAYATNSGGTAYGSQVSFTTALTVDMSVDDMDLWAKIGPSVLSSEVLVTPSNESVAIQTAYLLAESIANEQP